LFFENILKWKAPDAVPRIVAYRIFTDKKLHHLLFDIPAFDQIRFKVKEPNVNPCKKHRYFIVSVDEFGNTSIPVKGVRKVIKKNCMLKKSQADHFHESSSL